MRCASKIPLVGYSIFDEIPGGKFLKRLMTGNVMFLVPCKSVLRLLHSRLTLLSTDTEVTVSGPLVVSNNNKK